MSTIDDLETTFVEAVMTNLILDVELHKNYLRVYLKHTDQVDVTIKKLIEYIRKNFQQVKYFNIDKTTCTIDIYHYKHFDAEKKAKAIEEKL